MEGGKGGWGPCIPPPPPRHTLYSRPLSLSNFLKRGMCIHGHLSQAGERGACASEAADPLCTEKNRQKKEEDASQEL